MWPILVHVRGQFIILDKTVHVADIGNYSSVGEGAEVQDN